MLRPTKTLGVDIGAHSIKAVMIDHAHDQPVLLMATRITVTTTQRDALETLKARLPAKTSRIVTALHGHDVIVRTHHPASANVATVRQHITKLVATAIPDNELHVDVYAVPQSQQPHVIYAAAKTSAIHSLINTLAEVELQPTIIDADVLALYNAWQSAYPDETFSANALIDVGATTTGIHVIAHGLPVESMTIPIGIAALQTNDSQPLASRIATATQRLIASLSPPNLTTAYITGGAAAIPVFLQTLGDNLQTPTLPLNPFTNLYADTEAIPTLATTDPAPLFAVATGLALRI